MTIPLTTIRALERLLTIGEVPISDISTLKTGETLGLWTSSADGSRAVATSETVRLLQALPSVSEAVAAVISCEPDIRQAWSKIIAAQLKELGQRRDIQGLCEAIDTLGQAAGAIAKLLPAATLTPTSYIELERAILDAPAEQAIATPKLLRVLGATAYLVEGKQGIAAASLPDIDLLNPSINWVRGRLLRLPEAGEQGRLGAPSPARAGELGAPPGELGAPFRGLGAKGQGGARGAEGQQIQNPKSKIQNPKSSILSGDWAELTPAEINSDDSGQLVGSAHPTEGQLVGTAHSTETMRWVLYRPWAFLLAQVVFTQEAWAAERISGKLSLELEESQLSRFHQPTQVLVVVTTSASEEVICGTLAELLLLVLSQLGVSLLAPKLSVAELDNRLALVIDALLQRQVWQFALGNSGQRSGYTIHPSFSDSCYRALGSKSFNRLGSPVTAAIRNTCDRWVSDKLIQAGSSSVLITS